MRGVSSSVLAATMAAMVSLCPLVSGAPAGGVYRGEIEERAIVNPIVIILGLEAQASSFCSAYISLTNFVATSTHSPTRTVTVTQPSTITVLSTSTIISTDSVTTLTIEADTSVITSSETDTAYLSTVTSYSFIDEPAGYTTAPSTYSTPGQRKRAQPTPSPAHPAPAIPGPLAIFAAPLLSAACSQFVHPTTSTSVVSLPTPTSIVYTPTSSTQEVDVTTTTTPTVTVFSTPLTTTATTTTTTVQATETVVFTEGDFPYSDSTGPYNQCPGFSSYTVYRVFVYPDSIRCQYEAPAGGGTFNYLDCSYSTTTGAYVATQNGDGYCGASGISASMSVSPSSYCYTSCPAIPDSVNYFTQVQYLEGFNPDGSVKSVYTYCIYGGPRNLCVYDTNTGIYQPYSGSNNHYCNGYAIGRGTCLIP